MHAEVAPETNIFSEFEACIELDISNSRAQLIDHIRMNNRVVSLAYLAGELPVATLESALEIEDYIQIQVTLLGKQYTVRVYQEKDDMLLGTYTKEGELV